MSKNTNIDLVAPKELGFQLLEAIMIEATIEEIRALMEHGASINIKDYSGETPLYKACLRNNAELATFLIEHEADVNIRNNDGWTPLHRACYHNNTELAALLIEHGAGINIRNNNGWTPLHHACYHNNTGLTALLIEHGADINIKDQFGETLLYWTCYNNNLEIATFLLNGGAEVDLSLLKAFVRYDERRQIDEIIDNRSQEHVNLHLREDANIETIGILDMLYFPAKYDGIVGLIGNAGDVVGLQFEQECLLK